MLPIYKLSHSMSLKDLFKLEHTIIKKDWFGTEVFSAPAFFVAVCPNNLYFGASRYAPACFDSSNAKDSFAEGLWKMDAAELFIKDDNSNAYQEFNLGPQGAWWTGLFSSYRINGSNSLNLPKNVQILSEIKSDSWRVAMLLPVNELSISCKFDAHTRLNVAFTLGNGPQLYLTWAAPKTAKPDFHRTQDFETAELRPVQL